MPKPNPNKPSLGKKKLSLYNLSLMNSLSLMGSALKNDPTP